MIEEVESKSDNLIELTANLASGYVSNNPVPVSNCST